MAVVFEGFSFEREVAWYAEEEGRGIASPVNWLQLRALSRGPPVVLISLFCQLVWP